MASDECPNRRAGDRLSARGADVLCLARGDEDFGIRVGMAATAAALEAGGARVSVLLLAEGQLSEFLRARGLRVHALDPPVGVAPLPSSGGLLRLLAAGRWIPPAFRIGWRRSVLDVATPLAGLRGPAVLNFRSLDLLPVATVIARRTARVPLWQIASFSSAGRGARSRRWIQTRVLTHSGVRVLANSKSSADRYAFLGSAPPWAYVPIELEKFRRVRGAPRTHGTMLFLSLGRITPAKGQRELLRAFVLSGLWEQGVRLRFVGVRDNDATTAFLDDIRACNARSFVEVVPFTDQPEVELAQADVLLTGQVEFEPFGQVAAQALTAGVPLLAVGAGGPAEMVASSGAGWHCPSWEPSVIAEYLRACVRDRERLPEFGRRGARYAEQAFAWSTFAERYVAAARDDRDGGDESQRLSPNSPGARFPD